MKKQSKKFLSIFIFLSFLILNSCTSKGEFKNFNNRVFYGSKGGQIIIVNNTLTFSGAAAITPNTTIEKMNKNADKIEKSNPKEYKNPKIIKKNEKIFSRW